MDIMIQVERTYEISFKKKMKESPWSRDLNATRFILTNDHIYLIHRIFIITYYDFGNKITFSN